MEVTLNSGYQPVGDEKMKTIGTLSVKNIGLIAAFSFLTFAGSALAAGYPMVIQAFPSSQSSFQNCGCDNKQGIEMYVQNLITDSQKRGVTCEMSMHIPACIVSYCSICGNQPNLMQNCIKAGTDYLANSAGFCAPQTALFSYTGF